MNVKVSEYLFKGREYSRTRQFLRSKLGLDDRRLRLLISREIEEGVPIVSSSETSGYWLPEDGVEGLKDLEQALYEIYSRQKALSQRARTYESEIQKRKWGLENA